METNKLQWKRIAEGDRLPCDSLLMKKDGTISSLVSCAGVKVGQDAYYLPAEELRILPKEVDLEKEIRCSLPKPAWGWNEEYFGKSEPAYSMEQMKEFAKHFFELGMRVNNPITAADRGIAEEIIINLKRVEKDYRINLTEEIEWVRNKVKKGE